MPSDSRSASWLTRERVVLAGLLLFTLVVRGGVMWVLRANLQDDPDAYREIAENVLTHGVYGMGKEFKPAPTAYRPPLYPILLSNLPAADGKHISLVKVAIVHVLLGVATVWLTYLTARRIVAPSGPVAPSRREGAAAESTSRAAQLPHGVRELLAGLLVACDPILLNQQTLVMTETLATFLAVLALWCLARFHDHRYWWKAGLAGGAIGLAVLCRPTFLPWLGLVAAVLLIAECGVRSAEWRKRAWRGVANFAAFALVAATVVSPWMIRNQREMGRPILTTTHGGYTLFLGNNSSFYKWLATKNDGTAWTIASIAPASVREQMGVFNPKPFPSPHAELIEDARYYRRAREERSRNPEMFYLSCFYRIVQLWSPLPNKLTADESAKRTALRYLTAAWYCGVYLLAAVGVWRLRWRMLTPPWVWGLLLCVAFTAVHTFYWSNLRMRAPLMPFVALVAAAALSRSALPRRT